MEDQEDWEQRIWSELYIWAPKTFEETKTLVLKTVRQEYQNLRRVKGKRYGFQEVICKDPEDMDKEDFEM